MYQKITGLIKLYFQCFDFEANIWKTASYSAGSGPVHSAKRFHSCETFLCFKETAQSLVAALQRRMHLYFRKKAVGIIHLAPEKKCRKKFLQACNQKHNQSVYLFI